MGSARLKWMLGDKSTTGPIESKDGKIIIWACEQHNCGNRNWSTIITTATGETQIYFYHDAPEGKRNIRYTKDAAFQLADDQDCDVN